jgi:hypothetical protein
MTAAAQPAPISPAPLTVDTGALSSENSLTPAELVAAFSATELQIASTEESAKFNGIVLAKAIVIVQTRLRIHSLAILGKRIGVSRRALYYWAMGKPASRHKFEHYIRELALLPLEETAPGAGCTCSPPK